MLKWLRMRSWRAPAAVSAEVSRPVWVNELLEALQKQSRASVKQNARLEATLAEQTARVAELGQKLERASERERAPQGRSLEQQYAPLFDALDGLDEASRLAGEPHLAAGLALIGQRVQAFCAQAGFRRVETAGRAPDARLYRIVGVEPRADVAEGAVSRVVRAAIVGADRVVREGEVLVASASHTPDNLAEAEHECLGN